MDHITTDTGVRHVEKTGAMRERAKGKGRYDLITPQFLERLALLMERGAEKYEENNWQKGMHLKFYIDSAMRHLNQLRQNAKDGEDHMAAVAFNVMAYAWTRDQIEIGNLPAELDDIGHTSRSYHGWKRSIFDTSPVRLGEFGPGTGTGMPTKLGD